VPGVCSSEGDVGPKMRQTGGRRRFPDQKEKRGRHSITGQGHGEKGGEKRVWGRGKGEEMDNGGKNAVRTQPKSFTQKDGWGQKGSGFGSQGFQLGTLTVVGCTGSCRP